MTSTEQCDGVYKWKDVLYMHGHSCTVVCVTLVTVEADFKVWRQLGRGLLHAIVDMFQFVVYSMKTQF